ncbi:MAG: hypothetical protein KGL92_04515 [Gammaproteobacteria bacterium]|nr:hypothetical protein [Gammaproteobacteria bacterium]
MSAYRDALVIDAASSAERLRLAGARLERCEGLVMLDGVAVLRPRPGAISCEVIDRSPDGHRCAEEFKVLVENAARDLARSALAGHLPRRPLRWSVVEDAGTGIRPLWTDAGDGVVDSA